MKPSEMTTEQLMERIGIGDASEMAAELRARAARLRDELRAAELMAFVNADVSRWVSNALARVNAPSATTKGSP